MLIGIAVAYVVGWVAVFGAHSERHPLGDSQANAWSIATRWPLVALTGVLVSAIIAYAWLDEKLRDAGL